MKQEICSQLFCPNWQPFNRPLSPSERFHLSRLEASDGLLVSNSSTGIVRSRITRKGRSNWKEVFRAMEIGDSKLVDSKHVGIVSAAAWRIFGAGNYMVREEGSSYRVWKKA